MRISPLRLAALALVALAVVLALRGGPRVSRNAQNVVAASAVAPDFHAPLAPRLSSLGLFRDVTALEPGSTGRRYEVRYPLWSDGAVKERHLFLPPGSSLLVEQDGRFAFPEGATLSKSFGVEEDGRFRRLETRVMRRRAADWEFAVYVWDEDGQDAVRTNDRPVTLDCRLPDCDEDYVVPGRISCLQCHASGGVAGFQPFQLSDAVLDELAREGALETRHGEIPNREIVGESPTEIEALGYLAGNCAHCHNPESSTFVGNELDLRPHRAKASLLGRDASRLRTRHVTSLVSPGSPEASVVFRLFERSLDEGAGTTSRMPPIGNAIVDRRGAELLREWIAGLPPAVVKSDDATLSH
ncbi:MAG: hypothetical protein R3F20_19500 [Planctomycetota bacterium]